MNLVPPAGSMKWECSHRTESFATRWSLTGKEALEAVDDVVKVALSQARVVAHEEPTLTDARGRRQRSHGPVRVVAKGGLDREVPRDDRTCRDAARLEMPTQRSTGLGILDHHGEAEPRGPRALLLRDELELVGEVGERTEQELCVRASTLIEPVESIELHEPERALDLHRAKVVADVDEQEARVYPRVRLLELFAVGHVPRPAVGTHGPGKIRHLVIVRHQHPALDGGDVVGEEERERTEVAERPDLPVVDRAAERLTGVLDDPQVVLPCELHQRFHVDRVTQEVDRHDRAGSGGQGLVQTLRLKVQGVGVDVNKNRHAAVLQDRSQRRRCLLYTSDAADE